MSIKNILKGLFGLSILLGTTLAGASGLEIASQLNERYKSTPDKCDDGRPAYACSGLLIHGKSKETYLPFWRHDIQAQRSGAEQFNYLRADISTRVLPSKSGVIIGSPDKTTAPSLDVVCAYPFAPNIKPDWTHYGCLSPSGLQAGDTDQSSCLSAGATNADDWMKHFQSVGSNADRQCSLSSIDPAQFTASLQAHSMLGSEWAKKPNQLQIRNWADSPDALLATAIFYDPVQANSLLEAQQHQLDYFKATDKWLDVLKLNLAAPENNVFSYHPEDQLSVGYEVADRLNARYMDTRAECPDNKASFYCNGVLLRGVWASRDFHSWNPSPGSIANNGVSFSYLRSDLKIKVMFGAVGLIFKNSGGQATAPIAVRCAYPAEAGTSGDVDPCTSNGVCADEAVTSMIIWVRRYKSTAQSCAFTNSASQFAVNNQITEKYVAGGFNELIIAPWPQDIPAQLPLEAIVHRVGVTGLPSLEQSQYVQRDYYTETGRYLPLLSMDQREPGQPVFSFDPLIQNQPGSPDSRQMKDGVPIELNGQERADLGRQDTLE